VVRRGLVVSCNQTDISSQPHPSLKCEIFPARRFIPLPSTLVGVGISLEVTLRVTNASTYETLMLVVEVDSEAALFRLPMTPHSKAHRRDVAENPHAASIHAHYVNASREAAHNNTPDAHRAAIRAADQCGGFFWLGPCRRRLPILAPLSVIEVTLTAWLPTTGVYNVNKIRLALRVLNTTDNTNDDTRHDAPATSLLTSNSAVSSWINKRFAIANPMSTGSKEKTAVERVLNVQGECLVYVYPVEANSDSEDLLSLSPCAGSGGNIANVGNANVGNATPVAGGGGVASGFGGNSTGGGCDLQWEL